MKTPVAVVLSKGDYVPECFDDPRGFAKTNLNRLWNICERPFHARRILRRKCCRRTRLRYRWFRFRNSSTLSAARRSTRYPRTIRVDTLRPRVMTFSLGKERA